MRAKSMWLKHYIKLNNRLKCVGIMGCIKIYTIMDSHERAAEADSVNILFDLFESLTTTLLVVGMNALQVRRVRYGWGGSITSKVRQCVDGNMGHSLLFSAGLKLGWTGFELTFANTSFGSIYSTMPSSSLIVFWSRLSWLNRVVRSSKLGG
ncbi:hypothetical protein YC2023_039622 [Brassica napus]